jgi:hypothetical protein
MAEKKTTIFYGSYGPRVSLGFIGSNINGEEEIGIPAPDAATPSKSALSPCFHVLWYLISM